MSSKKTRPRSKLVIWIDRHLTWIFIVGPSLVVAGAFWNMVEYKISSAIIPTNAIQIIGILIFFMPFFVWGWERWRK